jgi:hypothetical protein
MNKEYTWVTISIILHWNSEQFQVFCYGVPQHVQASVHAHMQTHSSHTNHQHPFALLEPLFSEAVQLYDRSVWCIRDGLREIELVRISTSICAQLELTCH